MLSRGVRSGLLRLAAVMVASVLFDAVPAHAQTLPRIIGTLPIGPPLCGEARCTLSDLATRLGQLARPSGFVWALSDVRTNAHAVGRLITIGSFERRGPMSAPRAGERYCRTEVLVMYFVPRFNLGFREQEATRHLLDSARPSVQPVRHWGNEANRIVGRGAVIKAECEDGRPYDFDPQDLLAKLRRSGF